MSGASVDPSDPDINYNLHACPSNLICMCFGLLQIHCDVLTRAFLNTVRMRNALFIKET